MVLSDSRRMLLGRMGGFKLNFVWFSGWAETFEETKKFADRGNVDAQYNLALMYYNGDGVPQDYKQAVKWFTKAAEKGDAHAQKYLGQMYYKGEGFPEDHNEAFKWYRKAAEQVEIVTELRILDTRSGFQVADYGQLPCGRFFFFSDVFAVFTQLLQAGLLRAFRSGCFPVGTLFPHWLSLRLALSEFAIVFSFFASDIPSSTQVFEQLLSFRGTFLHDQNRLW